MPFSKRMSSMLFDLEAKLQRGLIKNGKIVMGAHRATYCTVEL